MNDEMLDLLKNYNKHRVKAKALTFNLFEPEADAAEESRRLTAKLDFLDFCIDILGDQSQEQQELIRMLYFKGYSVRNYARVKHIAKSTADNRKAAALRELRGLFNSKKLK